MTQSADEKSGPEEEGRKDTRATEEAGIINRGVEGRDEGAEESFDIREEGLGGGSGQSGEEGGGLVKVKVFHGSSMPQVEVLRQPCLILLVGIDGARHAP